jgi:hypothetical protein
MKTIAPLQPMNLAKSFVIFFIITSLAWIGANYIAFRDFYIGWPVIIGNVLISGVLGWWWYRRQHHAIFSWDQQGFELQWGRGGKSSKEWRDFSRVSLVHEGYGKFLVRLYEDDREYLDIPVSDLKLDASDFRFQVMGLVAGRRLADGLGIPGKES